VCVERVNAFEQLDPEHGLELFEPRLAIRHDLAYQAAWVSAVGEN
jgi:hypothetical protein